MNEVQLNVPLLSFLIISSGSISCISGGYLSQKIGSASVASIALAISGICCLLSFLMFSVPLWLFLIFLFVWGLAVVPDSPQFSTLVAKYAPDHLRGTALTIYNSIGFFITTISLVVFDLIFHSDGFFSGKNSFLILAIGALVGLPSMIKLRSSSNE